LIEIDIKIFPKKSKGKLLLLLGHSTNIWIYISRPT
jgi:hypothetical protein